MLITIGLGVAAVIWHLAGDLKQFSKFVSMTAAITLSVFSTKFGILLVNEPQSQWSHFAKSLPLPTEAAAHDANRPDIYYIILDGYGRSDVLQRYYDFDNAEFLEGLRHRGFYVADKSSTNYPYTAHSLSSSLNMRYHE